MEQRPYAEVAKLTGLSRKTVGQLAWHLRQQGHHTIVRTKEEERRALIGIMPKGTVSKILSGLTDEQLKTLSNHSLVSWGDAIKRMIQSHE